MNTRTDKSNGELKIHCKLSPDNHVPLAAICRILDKPNIDKSNILFYPDYDHAQLRTLPAGTINPEHKTLEVTLIYNQQKHKLLFL